MTTEAKDRPDYRNKCYDSMMESVYLDRDVMGGTKKLRAKGTEYLFQFPAESDTNYQKRLKRSILYNVPLKTRGALVGMVTGKPITLLEDVAPVIVDHWENIDLQGSHGDVFARDVFTDAFEGHAGILVDMDKQSPSERTLADSLQAKRRPYWVKIKIDQIINWQYTQINGEMVLTLIVFEEKVCERDGLYGEREVTRQRVFRVPYSDRDIAGTKIPAQITGTVQWELYEKDSKDRAAEPRFIEGDTIPLLRIPFSPCYTRKKCNLESEPFLLDLDYMAIAHYQEYSDYRTQLQMLIPSLVRIGYVEPDVEDAADPTKSPRKQQVKIGAYAVFDVPTGGDAKYISHDGRHVAAAKAELNDLEARMAAMGISLFAQREDGNVTAREIGRNEIEQTSELSTAARSLKDCIEGALAFHAQYIGIADENGDGGSIELGVKSSDLVLDGPKILALSGLVEKKQLSLETFLQLMQMGFPQIDFSEEPEKIAEMVASLMAEQEEMRRKGLLPPVNQPPEGQEEESIEEEENQPA